MALVQYDVSDSDGDDEEQSEDKKKSKKKTSSRSSDEDSNESNNNDEEDDNDDDDDDDEDEEEEEDLNEDDDDVEEIGLPCPTFDDVSVSVEHSVFKNVYAETEKKQLSILSHHVKLREMPRGPFRRRRRGRGRRGGLSALERAEVGRQVNDRPDDDSRLDGPSSLGSSLYAGEPADRPAGAQLISNLEESELTKRKRRYGVTNSLQPPKRAMEDLQRMRTAERPWTVENR